VATVFRKLRQKRYWDGTSWLGPGETQADAAKCLETIENKLSVFLLDDPDDQVGRVVAALAVTRDYLVNFDLAIAPADVLEHCGVRWNQAQGRTPDAQVNVWHKDLVDLTITKVACLANAIRCEGKIRRYSQKKVETVIRHSLDADYIVVRDINSEMTKSLQKRGII